MKICTKCKQEKLFSAFLKNRTCKDGYQTQCRSCMQDFTDQWRHTPKGKRYAQGYSKEYYKTNKQKISERRKAYNKTPRGKKAALRRYLRNKYNITLEFYLDLRNSQGARCAICDKQEPLDETAKILCLDHNHETGQIRELICLHCNTAIGFAKENTATLQAMIQYIEKHNI